jgi:hypothetical protein
MNIKSSSGIAILIILPWIAGAAVVAWGYHEYKTVFAPGRDKKQINSAASSSVATYANSVVVDNEASSLRVKLDEANKAHVLVIKSRDDIDDGVNGRIECARTMLGTDKTPTPAEVAAQIILQDAQQAIGRPLTDKEKTYWTNLAMPLIKGQQDALNEEQKQREIAAKAIAVRDAVQADSEKKDNIIQSQVAQLKDQTGKLVDSAKKTEILTSKVKEWADNEPGLWTRIKALGWLAGILSVLVVWYEIKRRGITGAVKDAVALTEHVKTIAVNAGHDPVELDKKVNDWWDGSSAKKLYDKTKEELRQ